MRFEAFDLCRRSRGVDLHFSVSQIAHPARYSGFKRNALSEIPESNALNPARNQVLACD
jgi:hypothetical protein